tara:strand:+ start:64071 stop:64535 length:465 start_codon:yes stop_codon:yes gene_type:complete
MWQRIQSLYFLLTILSNTAIFWLEIAVIHAGGESYSFTLYKLQNIEGQVLYNTTMLAILCSMSIVLSGVAFGMFKRRQVQIKLSQLLLLVHVAFLVAIFFVIDSTIGSMIELKNALVNYGIGSYLALIPLVFIFLAIKGIKKDEALIRAADRIR